MIDLDIHGNTKPLEASVQAAINRIRRQPIKITVDDKGATQPLGNMKRGADEFSKSMEAANARIIAFGASMAIINGVSDAFKGMVKNMVEVEKALADINVVMGLSAKNLDKFSDSLFKVAKETGAAFNIAAQAATEYARQGLAVEESLKRTKDALILTRLTGMDSAEAVKSLTAAMNTYGSQIKDTTQLVSKFAAVDVQFAVSAEDFADAIARTGAAAKGAGVDIDELIGFVTAAQQQTARGGKVIGNSLKTIFTRVGRTDTLNQLEGLGIAVRDLEGKTLGAKRILTDLANTFDKLSESQKAQIAQTVGGVFQINVLKAVLGDAAKQNGILSTATQIAAGATDEAITKNEQLRETMSAMATETGLAIKQLSAQIGEIMLAPGMEKILNTVKSFAESASGILGDGESTGNKFATGFLKGLGNIITGPGLVVLTTVFVKLFAQAFKFTKDSLNSLVGITTQAQKQKAIQTSLVALFGQNAALNKEMLRTDISRAEKEKIILGLIEAQVAQARTLNEVSKQAASTLYRQGYGPNLSPRRNRAYGHIPNFSERQQAAEGGYAAGNIRAMDMPGQGSVIYNSAEQVKNFAGFKQPAIMPPQSSKAGKNYQKAFGEVHGFDPYAADGFIPNFNKGNTIDARHVATMLIPFEGYGRKVSGGGSGVSPGSKGGKPVFGQKINKNILFNIAGVKKGGYTESALDNQQRVVPQALQELGKVIGTQTVKVANQLQLGPSIERIPESSADSIIKQFMGPEGGRSGAKGAISGLYGAVFEEALSRRLKTEATDSNYMGGDFDVRMATPQLKKLYGPIAPRGDFKISDGRELQASMAAKIAKEIIFRGSRGSAPKNAMAKALTGKESIRLGLRGKSSSPVLLSGGFIPNYANPLADAISRERQAGVPVSQIRVDSHPALVNKSNPVGLGVTNTKDEPNGLRDVFGAKGFVPNYAMPGMITDLFSGLRGNATVEDYNAQMEKSRAEMAKHDVEIKKLTRTKQRYDAVARSSTLEEDRKRVATQKATATETKLTAAKAARAQAEAQLTQQSRQRSGAQIRGNAGMSAILGLPMAAAYLQTDGPGQTGSKGTMYGVGGALQGAASTGYMASMIAPFFGPAAPFVVAAGALYGAFDGYTSAMEENTAALKQKESEIAQSNTQKLSQDLGSQLSKVIFKDASLPGGMKGKMNPFKNIEDKMERLQVASKSLQNAPEFQNVSDIITTGSTAGQFIDNITFGFNKIFADPFTQFFGGYNYSERYGSNLSDQLRGYEVGDDVALAQRSNIDRENIISSSLPVVRNTIRDAMKSLGDEEIYVSRIERDSEGRSVLSDEKYNVAADKYLQALESSGILDNAETVAQLGIDMVAIYEQQKNAAAEQVKGILVEIDKQKAQRILKAQIFDSEMKIKRDAVIREGLYSAEIELHKGFLSERRQSEIKYNKALDAAADALQSGTDQAIAEFRNNIITVAQTDPVFRAQLAANLPGVKNKLTETSTQSEITEAVVSVDFEELKSQAEQYKAKLQEIKDGETEIDDAKKAQIETMASIIDQLDQSIHELEEVNDVTKAGLDLQKSTNSILDERKRIIRENTDELRKFNEEAGRAERIRGYEADIQDAALQASGQHVTQEQKALIGIARAEGDVRSLRDRMTSQRNEALGELNLSPSVRSSVLSGDLSLSEANTMQKEMNFANSDNGQKLQMFEAKIARERMAPTREPISEEQALGKESYEEYQQILKLKEQATKQTSIEEERLESIKSTLKGITLEEEKGAEAIRSKARARLQELKNMQGPEALGKGFKRGIDKMNEQVKYMDYELGQKIPENLANGLADAMGAALDGTKKLDDALMDVAINFLQMIQQAFLQKAAYQIVGGIGGMFNNGGAVRNYSKGGSVPAYVSDGEYVMNRQAVNKYGGAFMHNLNNGGVPKYHGGGSVGDFFGRSTGPSVGDFFKNQSEIKPRSIADFFSSPAQARSSANNSAAIRRAINGNMGDIMQRKDFSSKISSSSNAGMMAMNPGSDVSAALNPQPKSGGGFFGNLVTGIGNFTSGIFDALFTPIKAVGSFFGFPGFSNGGGVEKGSAIAENFGGGRGIDTGRLYQRKAMSGYFYSQSNNVGVAADRENMIGVLREEERARQEAEARRRAKKARRKSLLSAALGAVVSMGVSAIAGGLFGGTQSAAEGLAAKGPEFMRAENLMSLPEAAFTETPLTGAAGNFAQHVDWASSGAAGMADAFQYHMQTPAIDKLGGQVYGGVSSSFGPPFSRGGMARRYSFGGGALAPSLNPTLAEVLDREEVQKKNAGGWISGKSGIDQIPAMLSDGEYVIKASSARKLGRPMLDQINAGKFNEGGAVGDDMELVSDNSESESSGGNVNNISITVNVEKGQAKEESRDQSSKDPADSSEDEKNSAELAERVRHQVVSVIIEEQRPGGLLANTKE